MLDTATYQRLLNAHGRRVANRAAVSQMPCDQRDLGMFYAMYSSEKPLTEGERCQTGLIDQFDPAGFHAFYRNRASHYIEAAAQIQGTTRDWLAEVTEATGPQLSYLRALVVGNVALDDASAEWQDFADSTNNIDAFVLFVLFEGRWPRTGGNALLPNEDDIANGIRVRATVLTDEGEK